MISQLTIDNYALIDRSEIKFGEGFTVITGETGAGKSIMLDALSLLMGARADAKAVADKNRKTIVEAIFPNPDTKLENIFRENGIDWDEKELIIRREVSPSGKSRSFINDTPVNLSILSSISQDLVDIHSQHSNSLLNRGSEQLAIIDSYAQDSIDLSLYQESFRQYVNLRNRIKKIKESRVKGKEIRDYIMFRLEQLDKLKLKEGELQQLEQEAEILGDADRIKSDIGEAVTYLSMGGNSALRQLQNAAAIIDTIDFSLFNRKETEDLSDRLNSLKIELRDISDTLESIGNEINADPQRFEKVQSRIENIYELMKRFKAKDDAELLGLHRQLRDELQDIDGEGEDEKELESQLKILAKELKEKADKLTEIRTKSAEVFAEEIEKRIEPLGLSNVKFRVIVEKGKMAPEGQDIVAFYCSFNKNHPLQPVSEIASGGEISRVMLGIKSVMAEKMNLPTVIFDEIDTGVSGEIAHKMGKMMKEMSHSMQVMSVTHLPQVAAAGDSHLKVYKADDLNKTVSHVVYLQPDERVKEIAGMLSGTTINDVAMENARSLLNSD